MKRLWKPMLCMLLAVLMLSSCSGQPSTTEQFPEHNVKLLGNLLKLLFFRRVSRHLRDGERIAARHRRRRAAKHL